VEKPSERIMLSLEGRIPVSALDDAERSAMRFPIYRQACAVLSVKDNQRRAEYLDSLSPDIRDMLKKECRRIFDLRRGKK